MLPEMQAVFQGAYAMHVDRARLSGRLRLAVILLLIWFQDRRRQEGDFLIQQRGVTRDGDVMADHEGKEEIIIGDARADSLAGRRVPPVLHVALGELPTRSEEHT